MGESSVKVFSGKEVAQHNSRESCWIIVHGMPFRKGYHSDQANLLSGKVYDVTEFLDDHPAMQVAVRLY